MSVAVTTSTALGEVKREFDSLQAKLGEIGGRFVTVITREEQNELTKRFSKVCAEISIIDIGAINGSDKKNVDELLKAYYQLNVKIDEIDPQKKHFAKRLCYAILRIFGYLTPKFDKLGLQAGGGLNEGKNSVLKALTDIFKKVYGPQEKVEIDPEYFSLNNKKFGYQQVDSIVSALEALKPRPVSFAPVVKPVELKNEMATVWSMPSAHSSKELERYTFSGISSNGISRGEFIENYPLMPGQWLVTKSTKGNNYSIFYRDERAYKNLEVVIESSKKLPEEVARLQLSNKLIVGESSIQEVLASKDIDAYLTTLERGKKNEAEIIDLEKTGLSKNCWYSSITKEAKKIVKMGVEPGSYVAFTITKIGGHYFVEGKNQNGVLVTGKSRCQNLNELKKILGIEKLLTASEVYNKNKLRIDAVKRLQEESKSAKGISFSKAAKVVGSKLGFYRQQSDAELRAIFFIYNSVGAIYSLKQDPQNPFSFSLQEFRNTSRGGSINRSEITIQVQENGILQLSDAEEVIGEYNDFNDYKNQVAANDGFQLQNLNEYSKTQSNPKANVYESEKSLRKDADIVQKYFPGDMHPTFWAYTRQAGAWGYGSYLPPKLCCLNKGMFTLANITVTEDFRFELEDSSHLKTSYQTLQEARKALAKYTKSQGSLKELKAMIDGVHRNLALVVSREIADEPYTVTIIPAEIDGSGSGPTGRIVFRNKETNTETEVPYTLQFDNDFNLRIVIKDSALGLDHSIEVCSYDQPYKPSQFSSDGTLKRLWTKVGEVVLKEEPKKQQAPVASRPQKEMKKSPKASTEAQIKKELEIAQKLRDSVLPRGTFYPHIKKYSLDSQDLINNPHKVVGYIHKNPNKNHLESVKGWKTEEKLLLLSLCLQPQKQDGKVYDDMAKFAVELWRSLDMDQQTLDAVLQTETGRIARRLYWINDASIPNEIYEGLGEHFKFNQEF